MPVAKQQANQSWTTLLGLDAFSCCSQTSV
ncbi:hypothetical protein ACNKHL_17915 [Shigella flexneri]